MKTVDDNASKWMQRVVILSLLLLFFTLPHTLEDFATGEPAQAGVQGSGAATTAPRVA